MGMKKGETIARPIRNVDIVPTLCHLVGNRMPKEVEGGIIYQALESSGSTIPSGSLPFKLI